MDTTNCGSTGSSKRDDSLCNRRNSVHLDKRVFTKAALAIAIGLQGTLPGISQTQSAERHVVTLTEHDVADISGQQNGGRFEDAVAVGEFPVDCFPARKREPGHDRVLEGYPSPPSCSRPSQRCTRKTVCGHARSAEDPVIPVDDRYRTTTTPMILSLATCTGLAGTKANVAATRTRQRNNHWRPRKRTDEILSNFEPLGVFPMHLTYTK